SGKIAEIYTAELPKNLSDSSGVDVQVKCKRGGSVDKLMQELVEHTKLRDTLAFNFTVLVDNIPQTLSLRQILSYFVDFRRHVVTRRLEHELEVLRRRLHLLLAERAAADVIDRVVAIIRGARDDEDSRAQLMAELRYLPHGSRTAVPIDEVQAQHILDMALKRINALNRFRIDEEIRQKGGRVDEILATLAAPDGVTGIVREELKDVRKRYGRPRRTVIAAEAPLDKKAVVLAAAPADDVWAYLSADGSLLVSPRTGRLPGSAAIRLSGPAQLVAALATTSDQRLLVFTRRGEAVRVSLSEHQAARSGTGRNVLPPGDDEVVAGFTGEDAAYYLLVSERGQIKRIPGRTVANASAGGVTCCRVPDGDRLVAVVPHGEDDDILIAKAGGQVLRLETGTKLRPVPTGAAGMVAGTKLDAGDRVVSASKAHGAVVINLHANGMGLCVALDEYPVKGRATAGVQSVLTDRPAKAPAGDLALVACAAGTLVVFTDRGSLHQLAPGDLGRRASTSRPMLALGPGEAPRGVVAMGGAGAPGAQ
ncbi:MAG TPA: DNA gyrase subunit A, partial [Acidimicrobiales bacterium]|nr:DNA gyrase subunit A [Acidimicrobiales bacterium]